MVTYLYVKTHRKTGFKYLGKTIGDPYTYLGSGKHWLRHLNKHGADVDTVVIRECHTKEEVTEWGLYYSNLWKVVESGEWANLKPETGDGGSEKGRYRTKEHQQKIANANTGKKRSEEARKKMSAAATGRKWPADLIKQRNEKIGMANKGRKLLPKTTEQKQHLSEKLKGENNPRYGVKLSKETIRKRTESRKRNKELKKLLLTQGE